MKMATHDDHEASSLEPDAVSKLHELYMIETCVDPSGDTNGSRGR